MDMSVSLPFDKLHDIKWLAHALLWIQPLMVWQVMSFLARLPFMPMAIHSFTVHAVLFRVTC